jgi:hypothetical protein
MNDRVPSTVIVFWWVKTNADDELMTATPPACSAYIVTSIFWVAELMKP